MKEVYLDHASATPLDPRVRAAMEPYLAEEFGNPSSIHERGRRAKEAVDKSRETVARILGCRPSEVIFTSGATEADNIAIFGVAGALGHGGKKSHFITSAIEHHAVLKSFEALERAGHAVTYLKVDKEGLVDPRALERAARPETVLISIGYANNEIGTIQPVVEIGKVIKNWRRRNINSPLSTLHFPLFHSDASQAAGFLDLSADRLGVDLMTINGSKIYGPKGTGALFVKRHVKLKPIFYGGGQERELRAGTENVAGIVGLAKALEIAEAGRVKESVRLAETRDYFINRLLKEIPGAVLNGHPTDRLPNNINVSIPGVEAEAVVIYLDNEGIRASTGAACTPTSVEPSHVILALGRPRELAESSFRFTLGRVTTRDNVDYVMEVLPKVLNKLRRGLPAEAVVS